MKLKRLHLKNIRSYEDQEFEFPEGSILLSGDVGSGKTSVLLAIEYALFGLQPGQKGSSILRNSASSGSVCLEFQVEDKEIIVERGLKRGGKSVSNEYSIITIDGDRSEISTTELKTKIIELLGYPTEFIKKNNLLYRYTVYTPQEQMKQIIFEDPEVRLNIIRHIFGIDKYKKIRENLTILLNNLKENSKLLQGEISTLDQDKTGVQTKKDSIGSLSEDIILKEAEFQQNIKKRKLIESKIKELEEKIKERERFQQETEKTNILITTKKENISQTVKEAEEIQRNIFGMDIFDKEGFQTLLEQIKQTNKNIEELTLRRIELSGKLNSLENEESENLKRKDRVFKIDLCLTCLQDVPEAHKHNIINETEKNLSEIKKKVSIIDSEKSSLQTKLEREKEFLTGLEEKKLESEILKSKTEFLERSRHKLKELERKKESLDKDVTILNLHVSGLKEESLRFSKFENLFKINREELKLAFLEEKKSEIALAEFRKEIQLTEKEIEDISSNIKEKEVSKQKLAEIMEFSDWASNQFLSLIEFTERNVLLKLRVEFSKLFSKWFKMLVTDESLQVHLDENFTPLVIQSEYEMDYAFLSGGERTAIALAYRLALNQTINSVLSEIKTRNLVILDEPTDGFSESQLDKIRDIFEELNVEQLLVVSHEQKIESFVDNVIKIKKEDSSSSLENSHLNSVFCKCPNIKTVSRSYISLC